MWQAEWLRRVSATVLLGALPFFALSKPFARDHAAPDDFPSRTVHLIVGFAPGTPPDAAARTLADRLARSWNKAVVVENVLGASGNMAGMRVARAEPDGHTLLLTASSGVVINPIMYAAMPFDPLKDLAPVSIIFSYPNILVVRPELGVSSVQELVALARSRPGALTCASAGAGTTQHLSCEMLKSMAGLQIVHVPYNGAANLWTDLIAGRVDFFFGAPTNALAYARSGKVKALAVSSARHFAVAPDLPTIAEGGYPDFDVTTWWGLMAPADTPPEIIEKLHRDIVDAVALPTTIKAFETMGLEVERSSPDEFSARMRKEIPAWAEFIKRAGIKIE
jgi:tripartite-type tricarboxylate transporter receptor subunit TctC